MDWEPVIGLEIHAQLATRSKLFSGASTAFGAPPNVHACAIDLGLPGTLPVLNREAVRMAIAFGLAVDAAIAPLSLFARKNYFYPDLPKGYQISQYELPIVGAGALEIALDGGERRRIGITRAHLEEDAGKSLHDAFQGMTGIDLNRAGSPLLEIVSEPELRSAAEAVAYAKKIHALVRCLGICDGNMQEGSFRMDVNLSLRRRGTERLGTRTETKNLNSFRFMERAIAYEIERQSALLDGGGEVVQETRLFDVERGETRPMRSKEEANDYRYFPDPDLLPLTISPAQIEAVRAALPELPDARRDRFVAAFGLRPYDADLLTADRALGDYFEAALAVAGDARLTANWVMGELAAALNKAGLEIAQSPLSAPTLGGLIRRIHDGAISGKIAKRVFELLWEEAAAGGGDGAEERRADAVIAREGLSQITDDGAIETLIDAALAAHPQQAADYRAGKEKLLGFFVGQAMQASKGRADPARLNQLLKQKLGAPENRDV